MQTPDFARLGPPALDRQDVLFLLEHFPVPGVDAVEALRRLHERWNTLDSLLESRYVFDALHDRRQLWLQVSPRLLFNVLLRQALPGRRDAHERRTLHYLANLLALFSRTDRLYQVQEDDARRYAYVVDLVAEAMRAGPEREFLVRSHIGNYTLFVAGLQAAWVEHRHRYRRRPVPLEYYVQMGRSSYHSASRHRLAEEFGLRAVFAQLAERFDYYRRGLASIAGRLAPAC